MSRLPGPEAFNYGFPQELDDEYLVISDQFHGVPWKYVNSSELIQILCERIDEGFTFPLNPKWILCDVGWKGVYDRLLASCRPNVQESMDVWYPQEVRDKIARISSKYPRGFEWQPSAAAKRKSTDVGIRTDLAMLELRSFLTRQNGRRNINSSINSTFLKAAKSVAGASSHSTGNNRFAAALQLNCLAKEQQNKFQASLKNGSVSRRDALPLMKGPRSVLGEKAVGDEGGTEKGGEECCSAQRRNSAATSATMRTDPEDGKEDVVRPKKYPRWPKLSSFSRTNSLPGEEVTNRTPRRSKFLQRASISGISTRLSSFMKATTNKKKPQGATDDQQDQQDG